jgi:pantoate--beta-alanine ligase
MAKASVAEGKTNCAELKDMIIQQVVGSAGRVDYVEVSISFYWKWS